MHACTHSLRSTKQLHTTSDLPLRQTTSTLTRPSHPHVTHTAVAHCYYSLPYKYIRMYINNLSGIHTKWYKTNMEEAYTKLYNITSYIVPSDGEVKHLLTDKRPQNSISLACSSLLGVYVTVDSSLVQTCQLYPANGEVHDNFEGTHDICHAHQYPR